MKTILKIISLFVLVMFMGSCSSDKNSLTKEDAMTLLKQHEIDKPLQYTRGTYFGKYKFKHSNADQLKEINKLKQLETEGLINLTLVLNETKKYGSKTEEFSTYNVSLKPKHRKYIISGGQEGKNNLVVLLLTIKAKSVLSINKIDGKSAKVTVEFEKIKTPFYKEEFFVRSFLKDKGDIYIQEVIFKKDDTDKWKITNR